MEGRSRRSPSPADAAPANDQRQPCCVLLSVLEDGEDIGCRTYSPSGAPQQGTMPHGAHYTRAAVKGTLTLLGVKPRYAYRAAETAFATVEAHLELQQQQQQQQCKQQESGGVAVEVASRANGGGGNGGCSSSVVNGTANTASEAAAADAGPSSKAAAAAAAAAAAKTATAASPALPCNGKARANSKPAPAPAPATGAAAGAASPVQRQHKEEPLPQASGKQLHQQQPRQQIGAAATLQPDAHGKPPRHHQPPPAGASPPATTPTTLTPPPPPPSTAQASPTKGSGKATSPTPAPSLSPAFATRLTRRRSGGSYGGGGGGGASRGDSMSGGAYIPVALPGFDLGPVSSREVQPGQRLAWLRRSQFEELVAACVQAAHEAATPLQHADLALACSLRERRSSVCVLLCGTSGTGKSTLASLTAQRLGITTVVTTDSVRHMLRSFTDRDAAPLLWVSTYQAGEFIAEHDLPGWEGVPRDPRVLAVKGYKAQCEMVLESLDRLIGAYAARGESLVVEGVHLSLNFVTRVLMPRHPSVVPFLVHISNEAKHRERFAVRAKYMTLEPSGNRYVAYFRTIRMIQDYLVRQAGKGCVPKVDNTNVDRSVATIHATVLGCLRRRAKGEPLLDASTRACPAVLSEYLRCRSATWSSKDMVAILRRKRGSAAGGGGGGGGGNDACEGGAAAAATAARADPTGGAPGGGAFAIGFGSGGLRGGIGGGMDGYLYRGDDDDDDAYSDAPSSSSAATPRAPISEDGDGLGGGGDDDTRSFYGGGEDGALALDDDGASSDGLGGGSRDSASDSDGSDGRGRDDDSGSIESDQAAGGLESGDDDDGGSDGDGGGDGGADSGDNGSVSHQQQQQ